MKGGQFLVCLFVKLSQARYNYIGYWLAPNVQDNAGISTDWLFFQQGLGIEKYPIFDLFKHKGFQCLIGNLEIKPFGLNHLSKIAKKSFFIFFYLFVKWKSTIQIFLFFSVCSFQTEASKLNTGKTQFLLKIQICIFLHRFRTSYLYLVSVSS